MKEEEARHARNESVYPNFNERIAESAGDAETADFVCECADLDCQDRFEAPLDEYEEIREKPTTFIVAEGHELPAYEHVRRRRRGYVIVEKISRRLRAAVRRTDPRAGTA